MIDPAELKKMFITQFKEKLNGNVRLTFHAGKRECKPRYPSETALGYGQGILSEKDNPNCHVTANLAKFLKPLVHPNDKSVWIVVESRGSWNSDFSNQFEVRNGGNKPGDAYSMERFMSTFKTYSDLKKLVELWHFDYNKVNARGVFNEGISNKIQHFSTKVDMVLIRYRG
jgi:hypothetical protein